MLFASFDVSSSTNIFGANKNYQTVCGYQKHDASHEINFYLGPLGHMDSLVMIGLNDICLLLSVVDYNCKNNFILNLHVYYLRTNVLRPHSPLLQATIIFRVT